MNSDQYIGIVEHETAGVLYVIKRGGLLTAGTACNAGILEQYKPEMNDCFSLDENLQEFIDNIV